MKASSAGSVACVLRTGPSELGAFAPARSLWHIRYQSSRFVTSCRAASITPRAQEQGEGDRHLGRSRAQSIPRIDCRSLGNPANNAEQFDCARHRAPEPYSRGPRSKRAPVVSARVRTRPARGGTEPSMSCCAGDRKPVVSSPGYLPINCPDGRTDIEQVCFWEAGMSIWLTHCHFYW